MCAVAQHVLEVFKLVPRIQMRRVAAPTAPTGVVDLLCAWITTEQVVRKPMSGLYALVPKQLPVAMAASAELP